MNKYEFWLAVIKTICLTILLGMLLVPFVLFFV